MRKPIIAGNWKMHKTVSESVDMVTSLKPLVSGVSETEIVVAPPFTALESVNKAIKNTKKILDFLLKEKTDE